MSWWNTLFAILATLLLSACPSTEKVPEINFGHAPHDHHAALYIAASRPDYFKQQGGIYLKETAFRRQYELYNHDTLLARLNIISSTGGSQLIRKLTERRLDMAMGGVPAMIEAIDAGSPIRIIMPLMTGGAGLMLRKDIPVTSWSEFISYLSQTKDPVRIGYKTAASVQNLILEQALAFENIPFARELQAKDASLILVNMYGADNLIPGMRNGLLDGFVIMEPFMTLAQQELDARLICSLDQLPPEGQWAEFPCCALAAVDRLFIRDNSPAVVALVRLFKQAHAFIQYHPEEAAKIVAHWLDKPVEVELLSLPTIHFMNSFSPAWRAGVRSWVRALVDTGRLTGDVAKAERSGKLDNLLYDFRPVNLATEGAS